MDYVPFNGASIGRKGKGGGLAANLKGRWGEHMKFRPFRQAEVEFRFIKMIGNAVGIELIRDVFCRLYFSLRAGVPL
jgi:hypothetical protein